MGQYSRVETDGRLLIVTINRPEVWNALHPMANQELSDVFDELLQFRSHVLLARKNHAKGRSHELIAG